MFEAGGVYAPYDAPRSPSVESGEVMSDEEEHVCPPPPPLIAKVPTSTPRPQLSYIAVLCVRKRQYFRNGVEIAQWFEFLLMKQKDFYQFPQTSSTELDPVFGMLFDRKLISVPPQEMGRYFEHQVDHGKTQLRVYRLPFERTQRPKKERTLNGTPRLFWICESEMASHDQLGEPSAFGVRIAPWALAPFYGLPCAMRFASPQPPLVLYHGTEQRFKDDIVRMGLKPSAKSQSMLGYGVYFARWDKASDFASHDAMNVQRATEGLVARCIVAVSPVIEMTSTIFCKCGCGKPYVDHTGENSKGYRTVFVGDNAIGATRRAEWCVKDPEAILLDGFFTIQSSSVADYAKP